MQNKSRIRRRNKYKIILFKHMLISLLKKKDIKDVPNSIFFFLKMLIILIILKVNINLNKFIVNKNLLIIY